MIITDHRTLRGMEIKGYIVRNGTPRSRERHWTGAIIKVPHVSRGPRLDGYYFKYRGKEYELRYFDGCFKPFVVTRDHPRGGFV